VSTDEIIPTHVSVVSVNVCVPVPL